MKSELTYFQRYFDEEITQYAHALPDDKLNAPIKYILSLGGKRIRPVLLLLAGKAFGKAPADLVPAALAIELFHNFSLVHDDIMDNAPLRRGNKSIHEKWHLNAGILSGDAMLILAYKLIEDSPSHQLVEVFKLFNQTAYEVCLGQQLDMDFESRDDITIQEYLRMIELKTAVLLGCSLKMGALLAGASHTDAQHLYEFGRQAGIGFQVQDDYLDLYGDSQKFGKRPGGDILANKKTYLYLCALERAAPNIQAELKSLYSTMLPKSDQGKIQAVSEIYNELNVGDQTLKVAAAHFAAARKALAATSLPDAHKLGFLEFLNFLRERQS